MKLQLFISTDLSGSKLGSCFATGFQMGYNLKWNGIEAEAGRIIVFTSMYTYHDNEIGSV